jgi:hypothetical protein
MKIKFCITFIDANISQELEGKGKKELKKKVEDDEHETASDDAAEV